MAKRLTERKVRTAGKGIHVDEHGLRLRVTAGGSRQFIWRGTLNGRVVDRGLGAWPVVTLEEARDIALDCKRAARRGDDPRSVIRAAGIPTFAECAEKVISLREGAWKDGGRTGEQWKASLRDHAGPIMETPVNKIDAGAVLGVLTPIWLSRPETANRVRVRIGAVLKWALAQGYRADDPSEAIKAALPAVKREKVHHRAVHHRDVADVLRKVSDAGAFWSMRMATTFATLTATRSGEARSARWDQVDMDEMTWTIPAESMKMGKAHRVPLSRQALDVLREARRLGGDRDIIFPAARADRPVAGGVLGQFMRDMNTGTLHGMRASFRSWCADTGVDREVAEAALAHVVQGVEGAYQRSDLCERRRELMQRWADYITTN